MSTPSTTGPAAGRGMWRVVAEREVSTQVRSKAFLIQSGLLLVGLIGMVVLYTFLGDREQTSTVGVVDEISATAVDEASAIARSTDDNAVLEATRYDDVAAAEDAVLAGDVDAALLPAASGEGYELVGEDGVSPTITQSVTAAVSQLVTTANAAEQDVDLAALVSGADVGQRLLDPDADDAGLRQAASFIFVLLFYVTALTFGLTIAGSVTQEKESRVVEILAASVPIRALLWGKIAGASVLAIGQTVVLALAGVIGLVATGNLDALGVIGPAIGWYVVFFVLGFVTLASLWSVAGALASRQQDLGGATAPLQILLFAPYLIAVTAGEGVRTVVSMLPVVSTMLMPARLAEGDVPAWQLAVAIVVTLLAAVLFVRLGARVYENNLLRTGNRISFREAWARRSPADA